MSSYLDIAAQVLDFTKHPLSARQIMAKAYTMRIVPQHLYGATQHKTLQARLSEDILVNRESSAFFRPRPGHFFLKKFMSDETIPIEHRLPIAARRRARDLLRGPALAVQKLAIEPLLAREPAISKSNFFRFVEGDHFSYVDPKAVPSDMALIWATSVVVRGTDILTYRSGRYRDGRDAFEKKQTFAFASLVNESDRSLFDDEMGVRQSAIRAAVLDLDFPVRPIDDDQRDLPGDLRTFLRGNHFTFYNSMIAMVVIECPEWFEPTTRRLSLNDLHWVSLLAPRNSMDDYDPWSVMIWNHLSHTGAQIR